MRMASLLVASRGEKLPSCGSAGKPAGRLAGMDQVIAWAAFAGAWLLIAVMLGLSVLNTALRMSRDITAPGPDGNWNTF